MEIPSPLRCELPSPIFIFSNCKFLFSESELETPTLGKFPQGTLRNFRISIMKIIVVILFTLTLSINSFAQNKINNNKFISLSVGQTSFGTGDILGPGITIEFSKKLSKRDTYFWRQFLLGAEFKLETGARQPEVINPTVIQSFYQTTNLVFSPKGTFFPFPKTFLRGINISVGASVGYTYQTTESQASYTYDSLSHNIIRTSYLEYNNGVLIGYRVTAGYEYFIARHLLLGAKVDFDSYSNGDINTLLAGKIGYRF